MHCRLPECLRALGYLSFLTVLFEERLNINSLKSSSTVPASIHGQIGWFNSELNKVKHFTHFAVLGCNFLYDSPAICIHPPGEREVIIAACDSPGFFGNDTAVFKFTQMLD